MGALHALKSLPDSVIWSPNAGGQVDFLLCPIRETLLEGPRGTGKTEALLAKFAGNCGSGYGLAWRGIIFRREYKHLDDLISKSKVFFRKIKNKPKFLASAKDYKWVWPTGEELLFRTAKTEDDYWSYHGHEYPFVAWEELTNWLDLELYYMFKSINRSSFPGIPKFYLSTTNPYGRGHHAVKSYWIDPCPIPEPGGIAIKGESGLYRVRIHVDLSENPHIFRNDPEYIKGLKNDPNLERRKAWFFGSWDISVGGFLDGYWDQEKHVVEPFDVPDHWVRSRALDWGYSRPYAIGWFAKSPDGVNYMYRELYGYGGKANVGTRELADEVAAKIIDIERDELRRGIKFSRNPADSSIFDNLGTEMTVGEHFRVAGVRWVPVQKGPGSREKGAHEVLTHLKNETLKIFSDCVHFLRTVPTILADPDNPDDVDTETEDHDWDMLRYYLRSRQRQTTAKKRRKHTAIVDISHAKRKIAKQKTYKVRM